MSHFAELDATGIVIRVIVIEPDVLATGKWGDPANWRQCSYNTQGGAHRLGGVPLRKNYPGPGYKYDAARDAFIPPKPFASWLLNERSCLWQAPVPMPADGKHYDWDEKLKIWVVLP